MQHLLGPEYFMLFLSADPTSEIRSVIHDEGVVHHLPPLLFFFFLAAVQSSLFLVSECFK